MQAAREAEAADRAARRRGGAGAGDLAAAKAEFGGMFVSLAGPAGLLDMEKCLDTAGRMGDAASRSGYGAGARMAASLAGIFADVSDIVNRPVDDGAIDGTYDAFRSMMGVLYGAGEEYRSGGDPEPAGWLEEVREDVTRFRSWADENREEIRRVGLQESDPSPMTRLYRGRICRDVVRKQQEQARAENESRGFDPIFPAKVRPVSDFFGEYDDPNISSADMIAEIRGRGPPDGYELVRIEDCEGRPDKGGGGRDRA